MTESSGLERLSPRQAEVFALLGKGLTNLEIAQVLEISPATVRTYVTAILKALNVSNRTEAVGLHLDRGEPTSCTALTAVLARPAIAVLPVTPLSSDPRVEAVARGLTCDLSCLLARYRTFPVIAYDSVRGLATPTPDGFAAVGEELRARYLVGATLRLRAATWRLVAFADDAITHERLWNERYDFADSELFDVQDEVVERLAASAYAALTAKLAPARDGAPVADGLSAWTKAHAGLAAWAARDVAGWREATRHFTDAVARDPALVLAHFGLGLTSYAGILNQWGDDGAARASLAACADRCASLAPHAGEGPFLWARLAMIQKDLGTAQRHLEDAIELNPSFAMAHAVLAQVLQLDEQADPAMEAMKNAVRLGPRSFVAGLATMHFAREEYESALNESCRALAIAPTYAYARMVAAAAAWWIGDRGRAATLYAELKRTRPDFVPAVFVATFGPRVASVQRVQQALEALDLSHRPG
ncbi:MAG: hypothetical protein H6745_18605 [Deltaproteobacteria bacterium]|nr:hypothetical protein [Deltaproteobacteria bacterium]